MRAEWEERQRLVGLALVEMRRGSGKPSLCPGLSSAWAAAAFAVTFGPLGWADTDAGRRCFRQRYPDTTRLQLLNIDQDNGSLRVAQQCKDSDIVG